MKKNFLFLGILIILLGGLIFATSSVAWIKANEGLASLDAIYTEQNVLLNYNNDGNLIDSGSTEEAEIIMSLLVNTWKFPAVSSDFDSNDPLVNTPSELMYQAATITQHVLHGTQTIILEKDVEYEGMMYEAGEYEFEVDGRYWTNFNRLHPLEGPARNQAWLGAFGVLNGIYAGTVADYQAGYAHFDSWRAMLEGIALILVGVGFLAMGLKREDV